LLRHYPAKLSQLEWSSVLLGNLQDSCEKSGLYLCAGAKWHEPSLENGQQAFLVSYSSLLFIGLSIMAGSPKDAYGMVRYALPHMHRGTLKVGSDAPDARLVALDGTNRFHIRERTGARARSSWFSAVFT